MTATTDWYAWHAPYDELISPQTLTLGVVQEHIRRFLDSMDPAGSAQLISLAAGQSRDVLPLLIEHPRGRAVRAVLVELDERNADFAEGAVASAGLPGVEVVTADAGLVDTFARVPRADLVLACGLFELLDDDATSRTVQVLPQLCAVGATVIWTEAAGRWQFLDGRFAAAGFSGRLRTESDGVVVGSHELLADPAPLIGGTRMFSRATGR